MAKKPSKPVVLSILDGWGWREDPCDNAIAAAHTPVFDSLFKTYPHTLLDASQENVGLPPGQCGNSEVGHMNIGAGRVVLQDLLRIDKAIESGEFQRNPTLKKYIAKLLKSGGTSHVFGLISPGGVHSHMDHILCMVETIARAGVPVAIHAILDGRDSPPLSARNYISQFERRIRALNNVRIVTICGRHYALDRDRRWKRTQISHRVIVNGQGKCLPTALEAIKSSYGLSVSDEFVYPCVIGDYEGMKEEDGLAVMHFRADRVRQILQSILDPDFNDFPRERFLPFTTAIGLTEYSLLINRFLETLFEPLEMKNTLGEILSIKGMRQLRITETEKYAHVTFFFNGGIDICWPGEERILIPSPRVRTYDARPTMSADEVTEQLLQALRDNSFDFIVINYANPDMVGHTGSFTATVEAVQTVDRCLDQVVTAVTNMGGVMLVTADHGNAEIMRNDGMPHTSHTTSPVPFIVIGAGPVSLRRGRLADIAPTILNLLQIPTPGEMNGRGLIEPHHDKAVENG